MTVDVARNDDLLRGLPLPLAQLYLRALNGQNAFERHHAAYDMWQATLKLLASAAIVEYASLTVRDANVSRRLQNLARPSMAQWWDFSRVLVPILATTDADYAAISEVLNKKTLDDLPRLARLDCALCGIPEVEGDRPRNVEVRHVVDRLVAYHNERIASLVPDPPSEGQVDRMGRVMLEALCELLGRVDPLAGHSLVFVADVRRHPNGDWLIERSLLIGKEPSRLELRTVPEDESSLLPRPQKVYLDSLRGRMVELHPLVLFGPNDSSFYFLNSRRDERSSEYVCYLTGEVVDRDELRHERRELMGRIFGTPIEEATLLHWAEQSRAEESRSPPPDQSLEGRTVGEFRLLSRIGRGGMGVVYRAWQPLLARQVALKLLLSSGDPNAEARFAREIRALGRVDHPNLVKAFASGVHRDQRFYAMELVEGVDLGQVCEQLSQSSVSEVGLVDWRCAVKVAGEEALRREQPVEDSDTPARAPEEVRAVAHGVFSKSRGGRGYIAQVVEIIRQATNAAHALHEGGVIHRDIKPGNIIITPDGHNAVLTDLGLAQLADEADGRLTRTRQFIGTLRYASPEQVLSVGEVDRRTDIYSLGATLYELVTLQPLHRVTEQTPINDLIRKIEFAEPTPPSRLNPNIPKDLEAIVLKCLEKDANSRYSSAAEMAADLQRFLTGQPIKARRVGFAVRGWRWTKRKPMLAALCATAIVALVGLSATAVLVWRTGEARRLTNSLRQFEAGLAAAKLDDQYLATMDAIIAGLKQTAPSESVEAQQRLNQKFGDAILDALHQPRLDSQAVERIQRGLALISVRDPARYSQLQQDVRLRLTEWEPAFELSTPFVELDRVFKPGLVIAKKDRLYRSDSAQLHAELSVPTQIACSTDSSLEVTFNVGWQAARRLGLAFRNGDNKGYEFLLSVADQRSEPRDLTRETVATFADIARDKGQVYVSILRNGEPLRVQEQDASQLASGPLRVAAKRQGDRLSVQINDLPSLDFFDGFPLATAAQGVFDVDWPEGVTVARLVAQRKPQGAAASPLEQADVLFDRGVYNEALAFYRRQITMAQQPSLRQEAQYKAATCLLSDKRASEALDVFRRLAAEPGDRWPILAALQLCDHDLNQNQIAEADAVIQSLTSRYQPSDIAIYIPANLARRILRAYEKMSRAPDRDRLDAGKMRNREQLVSLQTLMNAPRRQIGLSKLLLVKAYLYEDLSDRALEALSELLADPNLDTPTHCQAIDYYALAMIHRNSPSEALSVLQKSLFDEQGKMRAEYRVLLVSRSRLHIAMGDWGTAQHDVDEFVAHYASGESLRAFAHDAEEYADYGAEASLLMGWLQEQMGKRGAAELTWRAGFESSRRNSRVSFYAAGIMGSLSNAVTESDARVLVNNAIREKVAASPYVMYVARAIPSSLIASILRNMWRTPRGRELARRIAFVGHGRRRDAEADMALAVADLLRYSVQGTEDLSAPLSPDEDQLIWSLSQYCATGFSNGEVSSTQLMQCCLTLNGNDGAVGWQALAPTIASKSRGPFAYICGRRYTHLKRPDDAKKFFQASLNDAPAGSVLFRLAESALHKL